MQATVNCAAFFQDTRRWLLRCNVADLDSSEIQHRIPSVMMYKLSKGDSQ